MRMENSGSNRVLRLPAEIRDGQNQFDLQQNLILTHAQTDAHWQHSHRWKDKEFLG